MHIFSLIVERISFLAIFIPLFIIGLLPELLKKYHLTGYRRIFFSLVLAILCITVFGIIISSSNEGLGGLAILFFLVLVSIGVFAGNIIQTILWYQKEGKQDGVKSKFISPLIQLWLGILWPILIFFAIVAVRQVMYYTGHT